MSPFRLKFLKFLIFWRTCRDSNPESQRPKRRALSNWATGPQLFYIGYSIMNRYEKKYYIFKITFERQRQRKCLTS